MTQEELDQPCVNMIHFLAVEAAESFGWERWVGIDGDVICVDRFGAPAPGATVMKEYGFTVDHVVERALALVGRGA